MKVDKLCLHTHRIALAICKLKLLSFDNELLKMTKINDHVLPAAVVSSVG